MTFDADASQRLREERTRLAWSQQEAADHAQVRQEMWGRYERGGAVPGGDVLALFAAAGGDVHYVLTGTRGNAMPSADEQALLARYRALDARGKAGIFGVCAMLGANPLAVNPQMAATDMGCVLRLVEVYMAGSKADKVTLESAMEAILSHQKASPA